MKKDSVLKLRPDIEYVRKWIVQFEKKHGTSDSTSEILKVLKYLELVEEEYERSELYLEAFVRIAKEKETVEHE